MTDEPMLVTERWLTNADQTLRELTAPTTKKRSRGLFYVIRPLCQTTEWERDDEVWMAHAQPLTEDSLRPIANTTVKTFCRTSPSTVAPTTKTGDRFWAVLRGRRWEFVAGDDGKRFETAQAVTNVTAGKVTITDVGSTTLTCLTNLRLASYANDPGNGIPFCFCTGMDQTTGQLTWEKRYLVIEYETNEVEIATRGDSKEVEVTLFLAKDNFITLTTGENA